MTRQVTDCEHSGAGQGPPAGGVSTRRGFLKLAAAAGATGFLAACNRAVGRAPTPVATSTLMPVASPMSTAAPSPSPSPAEPTATPGLPDIVRFYPDVPSRVVRVRHAGAWDGGTLVPEVLRQMLDASITQLTGLNDVRQAWGALFAPHERIAIKVNTIIGSYYWTRVPLVAAVAECLQEAGVPAEQIVVFDRSRGELANAGFALNPDGPGVRCRGTEGDYVVGWQVVEREVGLSRVLLDCDALINMPILKQHSMSGISFAMKNHYGTVNRPGDLHGSIDRAIPELNALEPIRTRTRLIVGDVLSLVRVSWAVAVPGDSILMSFDPVAHDAVGLQLLSDAWAVEGIDASMAVNLARPWLENGVALGLGTDDPANMELQELALE